MKNKILIIISVLLFSSNFAFSQFEELENNENPEDTSSLFSSKFKENLVYGGDFGLQFGTVTLVNVSPQVGYRLTSFLTLGIGATYMFYKNRYLLYQTSIYGGSVFMQIYPLKFLVIHGEIQALNVDEISSLPSINRIWDFGTYAGIGYRSTFGRKSSVQYMILWNFHDTPNSVYTNPIFKISILI